MGVFGEVEIIIECKTVEIADKIAENLEDKVKKHINDETDYEVFHLAFDDSKLLFEDFIHSAFGKFQYAMGKLRHAKSAHSLVVQTLLLFCRPDAHRV